MKPYPAPEHRSFHLGHSRKRALLIHGFPGTPWEVRHMGNLLVEMGWEAHAPLLPGFGPNIESLGERSRTDWLDTVLTAFEQLEPGASKIAVIGFSMGSALAVNLAAQARVDRLVMVNPFSGLSFPLDILLPVIVPVKRSYYPFWRADFDDPWTRNVVGRILPDLDVDDLSAQERLRNEVKIPVKVVKEVQRVGSSAWQLAPSIDTDTLVVQGTNDRIVSPARTRRFVKRLGGNVRLREVEGGGHPLVWPGMPGHEVLVSELHSAFSDAAPRRRRSAAGQPQPRELHS